MQTRDLKSADVEMGFELDIQIITDIRPEVAAACNTNDGCGSTCTSSCVSNV